MRRAVTSLLRFLVRLFFRRIEIVGLEKIPDRGAVIFAVNHPNGLLDPLFVLCFAPRRVSFLAKAPLFRYPFIGWFVHLFDSIPVYRKQDPVPGSNEQTFARARQILAGGGGIAIFPEGASHSDPRLRELKTGAARIALGAQTPLVVIPAGIYYTDKAIFRSSALVMFGEPIEVGGGTPLEDGEPPAEAVDRLTDRIDEGLDQVTLQADSHQSLDLIVRAERIFTANEFDPLAGELELRRRFAAGYHYLREHDPMRLARLESRIARFESELAAAGLDPETLVPRRTNRLGRSVLLVFLLFPLALIGAVLHYPTFRLVRFLSHRVSRGASELMATVKFVAALLLYPLTWIAVAVVAGVTLGARHALLLLLIVPPLAWVALHVFETLDEIAGNARALGAMLFSGAAYKVLIAERRAIRAEIIEIAEELGFEA